MPSKNFKTLNSQLRILRSRGLSVKSRAKGILGRENYYNVINGYKGLFIDRTATVETYKSGADFDEIFAVFEFDRKLRSIFLEKLLKIENQIKTVVAYKFSEKYGHDNYIKLDNFKRPRGTRELQFIIDVMLTLHKAISQQFGKHSSVTHYVANHGYIPMWVLVNVLTFGQISKLFGVLKQNDRQSIAKAFGLSENVFKGYLELMSMFRNICAHDEPFYNRRLKYEIKNCAIHSSLAIPKYTSGKYKQGINDVFALLICLKELLAKRKFKGDFPETIRKIKKELRELESKIHTINVNDILNSLGFPSNWENIR